MPTRDFGTNRKQAALVGEKLIKATGRELAGIYREALGEARAQIAALYQAHGFGPWSVQAHCVPSGNKSYGRGAQFMNVQRPGPLVGWSSGSLAVS